MPYTPHRPWAPLSDLEWDALLPFLPPPGRAGRPCDQRARLDACFEAATSRMRWSELARLDRAWLTIHRAFNRHTHTGLWTRLLTAVAAHDAPAPLRAVESFICAAYRRAARVLNLPGITLARRLGKLSALPGPPHMLPDWDLSETLRSLIRAHFATHGRTINCTLARLFHRLHGMAAGRRHIPRHLEPW